MARSATVRLMEGPSVAPGPPEAGGQPLACPGRPIPERATPRWFNARRRIGSGAARADGASWRVATGPWRALCCSKAPRPRRRAQTRAPRADFQAEASGQDGGRPAPRPTLPRQAARPDVSHLRIREAARSGASPNARTGRRAQLVPHQLGHDLQRSARRGIGRRKAAFEASAHEATKADHLVEGRRPTPRHRSSRSPAHSSSTHPCRSIVAGLIDAADVHEARVGKRDHTGQRSSAAMVPPLARLAWQGHGDLIQQGRRERRRSGL
jgi:hypothetical protein